MKKLITQSIFFILVFAITYSFMNDDNNLQNIQIVNDEVVDNGTNTSTSTMQWTYGGYRFTTNFSFNHQAYQYYKNQSKTKPPVNYAQESQNYPYLQEVARILKKDADQLGYTGKELVAYLAAFVQQNVVYTKDPYNNGYDYPKYPIETLYEKKGDCEDSAILLVSLLKTFGFDAVLIKIPKHMAVAVALPNWKGSHYKLDGKKYVYIETTNANWKIGQIPPEYKKLGAELVKTPQLEKLQSSNQIDTPIVQRIDKTNPSNVKTVTINGELYTVKPNDTYIIKQDGLVINISHQ